MPCLSVSIYCCRTNSLDEYNKIHLLVVPYSIASQNFVFFCKTPAAYENEMAYQFLETLSRAKSDLARGRPDEWPDQWEEILPMFMNLYNARKREMSMIDVNIKETGMILDLYKMTQAKLEARERELTGAQHNSEVLKDSSRGLRRNAITVRFQTWVATRKQCKTITFVFVTLIIVAVLIVLHIFKII